MNKWACITQNQKKMNHFANNRIEYLRKKRKHPALKDGWDKLSREQQVQEMLYWKQKR